jgi:hypothetical protein
MDKISWQLYNAQNELIRRRETAGVTARPSTDTSWLRSLENQQPTSPPAAADDCATTGTDPLCQGEATHFPDIGLAALRRGTDSHYRVWLLARLLDTAGRGWLPLPHLYDQLCGGDLHIFEEPRLRSLLNEGDGIFWKLEKDRLWLVQPAKLAVALRMRHFTRSTTTIHRRVLVGQLKRYRAELFASWLIGRKEKNPISQKVIHEITGVPPRSQRRYCRLAGVEIHQNVAIGPRWDNGEQVQECAWEHGNIFQFEDSRGYQGKKGHVYIAWHLPNSYSRQQSTYGSLAKRRELNAVMKVLNDGVGLGNSTTTFSRRFFHNGKQLVRCLSSDSDEFYFSLGKAKTGTGMWSALCT